MSAPPHTAHEELPADWQPIGSYRSFRRADEHALVLLATGYECWLLQTEHEYQLFVPPDQFAHAEAEIHAYESESTDKQKPVAAPESPSHPGAWTVHLWTLALTLCFLWQSSEPSITERGLISTSGFLKHHEWWRPLTALFLHADIAHLLGNILGLTLFGSLLIRSIGPLSALLGTLLSGTLGNLLNLWLYYPDPHKALGASTAVFGSLGMLAACGTISLLRQRHHLPWRRMLIPFLAALILLGWMGGGSPGSNTDVGAHITGFLCGILLVLAGFGVRRLRQHSRNTGNYHAG